MTEDGNGEVIFLEADAQLHAANEAAFQARYGFDLPSCDIDAMPYRVGKARDGSPILYAVHPEDGTVKRLNSLYDPMYEADRWASRFSFQNVRLLVAVQGFLDGYYARALLKLVTRKDSYVAVYEADTDLFAFVCHFFDLADLFKNEQFELYLPGLTNGTFYKLTMDKIADVNRSLLYMAVTPGYDVEPDFFDDCESLSNYLAADEQTRTKLGENDALNFLRAIKGLSTNSSILQLERAFADTQIPGVIVSAGPSLRKNAALLKEIQDKALIIAVDRAVPVLNEYGIVPHMTATVDAIKSPVFLESPEVKDLPVLFYTMGNRATQDLHEGHMIYFGVGGEFYGVPGIEDLLKPYGNVGGSVATAIFTCLQQIGLKTIILVGQDLAYDAELHTHADGAVRNPNYHALLDTEGIDGTTVKTRYDWLGFLNFFEQEIMELPDVTVVDATEGGAKIKGTKILTLREAIDTYCTTSYNVAERLQSLPPAVDEEEAKRLMDWMRGFIPQLKHMKAWAEEGITFCDQVRKAAQYHKDVFSDYYVTKMNEAEKRRGAIRMQFAYMLLESYSVRRKEELPGDELYVRTEKDALDVYTMLGKYFRILADHAEPLQEEIRRVFGEAEEVKED